MKDKFIAIIQKLIIMLIVIWWQKSYKTFMWTWKASHGFNLWQVLAQVRLANLHEISSLDQDRQLDFNVKLLSRSCHFSFLPLLFPRSLFLNEDWDLECFKYTPKFLIYQGITGKHECDNKTDWQCHHKSIKSNKANMNEMGYSLKKMNEMDYGLNKINVVDCGLKEMKYNLTKTEVIWGWLMMSWWNLSVLKSIYNRTKKWLKSYFTIYIFSWA